MPLCAALMPPAAPCICRPIYSPASKPFNAATQLALLELQPQMQTLLATHHWQDEATRRLASIGLANYVAGALILPYGVFLQAAESLGLRH